MYRNAEAMREREHRSAETMRQLAIKAMDKCQNAEEIGEVFGQTHALLGSAKAITDK